MWSVYCVRFDLHCGSYGTVASTLQPVPFVNVCTCACVCGRVFVHVYWTPVSLCSITARLLSVSSNEVKLCFSSAIFESLMCVCEKVYVQLQALIFRSKVLLLDVNPSSVDGKMLSRASSVVRLSHTHTHTHTHTNTIETLGTQRLKSHTEMLTHSNISVQRSVTSIMSTSINAAWRFFFFFFFRAKVRSLWHWSCSFRLVA